MTYLNPNVDSSQDVDLRGVPGAQVRPRANSTIKTTTIRLHTTTHPRPPGLQLILDSAPLPWDPAARHWGQVEQSP